MYTLSIGGEDVSIDRRQQYRVLPGSSREVQVSLRLETGHESPAVLIDISAGGVAVAFLRTDAPPVQVAEQVHVVFSSERLREPLVVSGYIRRIRLSEDKSSIMYGVVFDDWTANRKDLTPKLRALFNEREAIRVEPREEDIDIEVVLTGKARRIDGTLRDISVLGMGMWVNVDDHTELADGSTVEVEVSLPDTVEPVTLDVEIRHIQEFDERTRVGLRFDDASSNNRNTKRGITQYVMARQLELAREDAERRRAMEDHYTTG